MVRLSVLPFRAALLCLATLAVPGLPAVAAGDVAAGGATTQEADNRDAFSLPAANIPIGRVREFFRGHRLFNTEWKPAPGDPDILDGLGPTYNQPSCAGCHVSDGRGRPPLSADEPMDQMVVRLGIPGRDALGRPLPHPVYGDQLQHRALDGVAAEARIVIETVRIEGKYGDGTPYTLRKPVYRFRNLAFGPLGKDTLISPRVAPAVFGSGLLEAAPQALIAEWADPEDVDGDGISGRVNRVYEELLGAIRPGRRASGSVGCRQPIAPPCSPF